MIIVQCFKKRFLSKSKQGGPKSGVNFISFYVDLFLFVYMQLVIIIIYN